MAEAQFNLATSYDNGAGVPEDDRQAVYWYTKAAGQNYGDAQYNLGIIYSNGEGVVEDDRRAHMWFNIAASNGVDGASENKDILGNRMSRSEIAQAQEMASNCEANNYRGC